MAGPLPSSGWPRTTSNDLPGDPAQPDRCPRSYLVRLVAGGAVWSSPDNSGGSRGAPLCCRPLAHLPCGPECLQENLWVITFPHPVHSHLQRKGGGNGVTLTSRSSTCICPSAFFRSCLLALHGHYLCQHLGQQLNRLRGRRGLRVGL